MNTNAQKKTRLIGSFELNAATPARATTPDGVQVVNQPGHEGRQGKKEPDIEPHCPLDKGQTGLQVTQILLGSQLGFQVILDLIKVLLGGQVIGHCTDRPDLGIGLLGIKVAI